MGKLPAFLNERRAIFIDERAIYIEELVRFRELPAILKHTAKVRRKCEVCNSCVKINAIH